MNWNGKPAAAAPAVDESLARMRKVLRSKPDDLGYIVRLNCGHEIWIAVPPGPQLYCGRCLDLLAEQARAAARAQEQGRP